MCTLSFLPNKDGYIVSMNRDENLSRQPGALPEIRDFGGLKAICPLDVEGGTWISVTETGITWALLNRNPTWQVEKRRSRGEIILRAVRSETTGMEILEPELLQAVLPFRLVRIEEARHSISEGVWDGRKMVFLAYPWQVNNWFSSGQSDELASQIRGNTFAESQHDKDWGTVEWLRRMHRSHAPERGAFSICVHRPDAQTVSYSEIRVSEDVVTMNYSAGPPCGADSSVRTELLRLPVQHS